MRLRWASCRIVDVLTKNLPIHGYTEGLGAVGQPGGLRFGCEKDSCACGAEPALCAQLHPALPYIAAEVVWAVREEMARTVEDVLARHTRALFLNANAAIDMAEPVAKLLAAELGRDQAWTTAQVKEFTELAQQYRVV